MNNIVNCLTPEPKSHSFVDTIHGLTDKLHQLSHLGHDDNKSKSGNFFNHLRVNSISSCSKKVFAVGDKTRKKLQAMKLKLVRFRHHPSLSYGHPESFGRHHKSTFDRIKPHTLSQSLPLTNVTKLIAQK